MRILRVIAKQTAKALLSPEEGAFPLLYDNCHLIHPNNINPVINQVKYIMILTNRPDVLEMLNRRVLCKFIDLAAITAQSGHLRMVKWAKNNGYPFTGREADIAATRGDLVMLKWLRKNKLPMSIFVCTSAYMSAQTHILRYLKKVGCDSFESFMS